MVSDKNSKLALGIFSAAVFCSLINPFHSYPYISFYQDLVVCIACVAAFTFFMADSSTMGTNATTASTPNPFIKLRFPTLLVIPLGIIVVILLQVWSGQIELVSASLIPIIYLLLFTFAVVLGASLALQRDDINKAINYLGVAYVLAALLSVILQQIQILGVDATPFVMYLQNGAQATMRAYANLAQPNQLALMYFFALASIWYFFRIEKFPAWACGLSAMFILWGIVLTQSRIGWILVPVFYAYTLKNLIQSKRGISHPVIIISLLAFSYIVLNFLLSQISQALGFDTSTAADHVGGRSERIVLWQIAWQLAAQHPWTGIGWANYGIGQVNIAADFGASINVAHSHNLILNLAVEIGWPAALLIVGSMAWWFYQTCIKSTKSMPLQFLTLCFVAVGVHSMVEFPLWYAYVLLPVGMFMGIAHQMRWQEAGKNIYRNTALPIFVLSCLTMVLVLLDYGRVVRGFRGMMMVEMGYKSQEESLKKPALTIFPQYFEYFNISRIKPHEGMSSEEINYIETWVRHIASIPSLNLLAETYALNGQTAKAIRTMVTVQRMHPIDYPKSYEKWKIKAAQDPRYNAVFIGMPPKDGP